MATSLAHDAKHEDWAETAPTSSDRMSRVQWLLWAALSVGLSGAFLLLLVDDYVLRSVTAVN
jgi:hypothetical protein